MKLSITATPSASQFAPLILRGPMSEAFAVASRLGCEGLEIHLRRPSDIDQEELLKLLQKHRLEVPTLGTGMAVEDGLCFSHPDPEIRALAVGRIGEHIELASRINSGVTLGTIFFGRERDTAQRREMMERALECTTACCREAEAKGVTLFLEALNRYETIGLTTLEEVCAVIDRIGSPRLKLLADTFHMNIEETDLAQALRDARRHLGHIHLVDSNREAPGHGHLDFKAVVGALKEAGYAGFLSFEVLPRPEPQAAARDAVEHTRKLLGA